jgi:hypothetical protein
MVFFRKLCVNLRDLFVRRTSSTPPHNPSIALTLRKNPHFWWEMAYFKYASA